MHINRLKLILDRIKREAAEYEEKAISDKNGDLALFDYYRHTGTQFGLQKAIQLIESEFRKEIEASNK